MFTSAAIERGILRKEIAEMEQQAYEARKSSSPKEAEEIEAEILVKQAQYDALGKRPRKRKMPG